MSGSDIDRACLSVSTSWFSEEARIQPPCVHQSRGHHSKRSRSRDIEWAEMWRGWLTCEFDVVITAGLEAWSLEPTCHSTIMWVGFPSLSSMLLDVGRKWRGSLSTFVVVNAIDTIELSGKNWHSLPDRYRRSFHNLYFFCVTVSLSAWEKLKEIEVGARSRWTK